MRTDKLDIDAAKVAARSVLVNIKLITAAEQGDPFAKIALHSAIMCYVERGQPLPDDLRLYLAEVLEQ